MLWDLGPYVLWLDPGEVFDCDSGNEMTAIHGSIRLMITRDDPDCEAASGICITEYLTREKVSGAFYF